MVNKDPPLTPWSDPEKYKNKWNERNQLLFELSLNINIKSFTEYGCGPKAPFNQILLQNNYSPAILYDQYVWKELDTNLVDFNLEFNDLHKSQCGVMSGVFEYIKNDRLSYVLKKLQLSHDFLLYSLSSQTERQFTKKYKFAEYRKQIADMGSILNQRRNLTTKNNLFLLKFNK